MRKRGRNWTETEVEQAIRLYLRTPFGRIHMRNPDILALARSLDRTPGSVSLKLANLASIDETLDRKGMSGASNLDRNIWRSYFSSLREQARLLPNLAEAESPVAEGFGERQQTDFISSDSAGNNVIRLATVRQGQQLFRDMVLASYSGACAITGIKQPEFLIAGHIRPWASDPENRMNPQNGICLNRLHDKAFEEGLIAINDDGKILYSQRLEAETRRKMERLNDTGQFRFPDRFKPDAGFLREHRETRFGN